MIDVGKKITAYWIDVVAGLTDRKAPPEYNKDRNFPPVNLKIPRFYCIGQGVFGKRPVKSCRQRQGSSDG